MTLVLSPQDLIELTSQRKPSAQARELTHLKIPFKQRRDGTVVVLRVHVVSGEDARTDTRESEPRLRFG